MEIQCMEKTCSACFELATCKSKYANHTVDIVNIISIISMMLTFFLAEQLRRHLIYGRKEK
jgi:hypothetical protein